MAIDDWRCQAENYGHDVADRAAAAPRANPPSAGVAAPGLSGCLSAGSLASDLALDADGGDGAAAIAAGGVGERSLQAARVPWKVSRVAAGCWPRGAASWLAAAPSVGSAGCSRPVELTNVAGGGGGGGAAAAAAADGGAGDGAVGAPASRRPAAGWPAATGSGDSYHRAL